MRFRRLFVLGLLVGLGFLVLITQFADGRGLGFRRSQCSSTAYDSKGDIDFAFPLLLEVRGKGVFATWGYYGTGVDVTKVSFTPNGGSEQVVEPLPINSDGKWLAYFNVSWPTVMSPPSTPGTIKVYFKKNGVDQSPVQKIVSLVQ